MTLAAINLAQAVPFLMIIVPFAVFGAAALAMALFATEKKRSMRRFLEAFVISVIGILLPLAVFLLSGLLTPDAKSGCQHGWLDCFHFGKLALTPFVLWGSAALYATDVYRVARPLPRWVVFGWATGAVVSGGCFVFGVAVSTHEDAASHILLALPLYVAIWYWARVYQLFKSSELNFASLVAWFGSTLPFWITGIVWSRYQYQTLPATSDCFVVTAATRGHRRFVGPFFPAMRRGRLQTVNGQLLTLTRFECAWRTNSPRTHRAFRRFYNYVGPRLARRIRSAWLADCVYVLLKPVEFVAALALKAEDPSCPPLKH